MKKSYYAIIPAFVRYDQTLTPNAKLLYGEITALCNEKGYCFARNRYFSDLYNVKTRSITDWISQLKTQGYIKLKMNYKENSKEIESREIHITNFREVVKKNAPPMENIHQDNIYNNINNNTLEYKKEKYSKEKCKDDSILTLIWKILPVILMVLCIIPQLSVLFIAVTTSAPVEPFIVVKVKGHQWY